MQPHSIFDPPFPLGFKPTLADHLQIFLMFFILFGVVFGTLCVIGKITAKEQEKK